MAKHAAHRLRKIGVLYDEGKFLGGIPAWKSIVEVSLNKLTYIKDAIASHICSNLIDGSAILTLLIR